MVSFPIVCVSGQGGGRDHGEWDRLVPEDGKIRAMKRVYHFQYLVHFSSRET